MLNTKTVSQLEELRSNPSAYETLIHELANAGGINERTNLLRAFATNSQELQALAPNNVPTIEPNSLTAPRTGIHMMEPHFPPSPRTSIQMSQAGLVTRIQMAAPKTRIHLNAA